MNGVVRTGESRIDYLYRLTLKALIVDENGAILVVKERGRNWWSLPGGGMDHGESVRDCLARELREEVNYSGNFTYEVIDVEEHAHHLDEADIMQVRIVFWVRPENMLFSAGVDGDEVAFLQPGDFEKGSYLGSEAERLLGKAGWIESVMSQNGAKI